MNNKNTATSLSALIHAEHLRRQHESLVFAIANAVAVSFHLRGDGHILQYVLDVDEELTDAEILISHIGEALIKLEQRQMPQVIHHLVQQLEQAYQHKGILVWDK